VNDKKKKRTKDEVMKQTQLIIIGIITILVSAGLSGCNSSTEQTQDESIIGTWTHDFGNYTASYTFYQNHSVYFTSYNQIYWLEYEITKDQITFTPKPPDEPKSLKYSFAENNQKLIFTETSGKDTIFERQ